ncbi:hypothetical protein GIB67_028836 [Kingdonia uniflora]|uniref:Histone-lysine N-methyltransferase ATX2 n=1 Tax=Kingdonia uniflora TaxID=39325 RepID=A0A7J7LT46_9MAGN|nr:hypothetical protein GIB67_028836 [Kingdonia uniflora]
MMDLPLQRIKLEEVELEEIGEVGVIEPQTDTPKRYLSLDYVYSSTNPCVNASGSMSKKVTARKLIDPFKDRQVFVVEKKTLSPLKVYTRRVKKTRGLGEGVMVEGGSSVGEFEVKVKMEEREEKEVWNCEVVKLGDGLSGCSTSEGSKLKRKRKRKGNDDGEEGNLHVKKWVELSLEDVDPNRFVGLRCKVYWPLDDDWYTGCIDGYNKETRKHHVKYEDGDDESRVLSNERIKFHISREEMQLLNLRLTSGTNKDVNNGIDYDEMLILAASYDDCPELGAGDIIWAKISGHATWPAVVVKESSFGVRKSLKQTQGERSFPVQFFGTHDFARINTKQAVSFLKGLHISLHLKCKQPRFRRSLEEAIMYLSEQKLPNRMLRLQNGVETDHSASSSGEDDEIIASDNYIGAEEARRISKCINACPFEIGDLQVISLGKIVRDSEYFHKEQHIWPEGYTAVRKFMSITDSSISTSYKMEVIRDPESKFRPLFRITVDDGGEFKGSTPAACWDKIYRRIRKMLRNSSNGLHGEGQADILGKSGSHMFGFSNPKVFKLIQELSYCRSSSVHSTCNLTSRGSQDLPLGYRPVCVELKDLDKCNICHMDEEYENNVFLQCDKCRMTVHARCYGELEPVDGVLWLCNLCRPGALQASPLCCLCPVSGGAMKPTTDQRWAHLACAIWIPETCFVDIKRMEPIDGLSRISKDRWKLLCSICGVSYGACIQCSNNTCRVAYHPLCARAAGLCVELEDEDKLHLMTFDEDDENQCIRLLSFCKKHRRPSNERSPVDKKIWPIAGHCTDYTPPINPSGCARSEPYNFLGRRGRKEPEALAAASLKRLFVENRPYLVSGYCQNGNLDSASSNNELEKLKTSELETPESMNSMAEKYKYMRVTFRKRLAFGKSGIHGFGIFAKHPHRAGDMVIEYTGELVRPSVADRREHCIYNSLVGAGTYMFRIDDERVVDATRAGSIAHLINHSCEPNCYSRVVSVHGDKHIIIFAKRDIKKWEELTYDYRFFSIDEQLACYCGYPRCRGVVNDVDTEEQVAKLLVPRNKLIDWRRK